ncbi:hypothetical protein PGTUg99_017401 [Puccinia graminis f. sp. tritici]|uniref:Uncharacterized protein n=1 Tax=Puccinia graminis f. sp. tritici TaxID=56615 RepID=A0A5B0MRQ4_PUCGR|nr:hypothetical protein PGTUg99_017401 [Puccinia graminis f. sp. tritici]
MRRAKARKKKEQNSTMIVGGLVPDIVASGQDSGRAKWRGVGLGTGFSRAFLVPLHSHSHAVSIPVRLHSASRHHHQALPIRSHLHSGWIFAATKYIGAMPMKDETSSSHITRSLSLPAVVCLILGPGSQIVYERPTALSKYKMPYALLGPFLLIGHYSDISLGLKSGPHTHVITVWRIIEINLIHTTRHR